MFSIGEVTAAISIIGTLAGASAGGYLGYQESGKIIGFTTIAYILLGATVGLALGAQIGSLIGYFSGVSTGLASGTFGTIIKMTPKLIQQLARMISTRSLIIGASGQIKGKTALSFGAGVVSGVITGLVSPDDFQHEVSVSALSLYGGGNTLTVGYEWVKRNLLGARRVRVPGSSQLALTYISGFNLGYFATIEAEKIIKNQ